MNNIKKLRQEKNLTQLQLAEMLKIDQTTVSKWELEKALPDTQMLIRLSEFFDVSIDYLLGRSLLYYPDRISNSQYSTNEKKLLDAFRSLPADLQQRTLSYVNTVIQLANEEKSTIFEKQRKNPLPRNDFK